MASYSPGESVLAADKKDPWASFFSGLFSLPGNLLNMFQMTPQISGKEFESPVVSSEELNSLISDINDNGLFGDVFSQEELDTAIHANANGDSSALRAIIDRASQEKTYRESYSGLEKTYKDITEGSDWNNLVKTLQEDIANPIYSKNAIESAVASNTSDVLRSRDANIEAGKETLAGRGVLNSGITADLVTQARTTADKAIRAGEIEIPTALEKENRAAKTTSEGLLSSLLGTKATTEANLGQVLGQLRSGYTPDFSLNDIANAIQGTTSSRESTRLANAFLTKQSLGETKQDAQNMFEDMMSVFGLISQMKSGGGSKPKSGGGGGFSILGTGGSANKSCIGINGIVILPSGCKRLFDVKEGDKVLTPYGFRKVKFLDIGFVPPESREKCIKIITNKSSLICTVSHPLHTEKKIKRADQVVPGDKLQSFKKCYKVMKIEQIPFVDGCDLLLEDASEYFVNGILVQSTLAGVNNEPTAS